jgi:serine O-acetyltransferase
MAVHHVNPQGGKLTTLDPIWERVRIEGEDIVRREPELATFIYSTVLHHDRLEHSVVHRLADRLDHAALSGDLIRQTFDEALRDDPDIGNAFRADLVAVYDRDPATSRFIDPLLYFKGFHALQTHLVGGVPDRYQSRRPHRPRHLPRSCHRIRLRRDRRHRG